MKPTRIRTLFVLAFASGVAGYFYLQFTVQAGFHLPLTSTSFSISLVIAAVAVFVLARPIMKYKTELKEFIEQKTKIAPKRVDPFYAVRILALAKAASLAASIFAGWQFGTLAGQLLQPVVANDSLAPTIFAAAASLALLACGLIVEQICKLPGGSNDGDSAATKNTQSEGNAA